MSYIRTMHTQMYVYIAYTRFPWDTCLLDSGLILGILRVGSISFHNAAHTVDFTMQATQAHEACEFTVDKVHADPKWLGHALQGYTGQ